MSGTIHIVCLDAPSPPDYGGAIDMYCKIKALAEVGHAVTLHYFNYNSKRNATGLEKVCKEIFTYRRGSFLQTVFSKTPYIVQSRINNELINRLNGDENPVLLEGLHCAGILPMLQSPQRVVVRMHNEEAAYYQHLAQTEKNMLKRLYFLRESRLLFRYQHQLQKTVKLACLSETDIGTFKNQYHFQSASFIPCFIPWQELKAKSGKGEYCLYHGNMAVSENEEAAIWLIDHVFANNKIPFWVAGKGITGRLALKAKQHTNIKLLFEPTIQEIDSLIANAHINVLPSMNRTGVKLKLLNALFNGRFCITNTSGVEGSRIEKGLVVADKPQDWREKIELFFDQEFTDTISQERRPLTTLYNNHRNAKLLSALW